MFCRFYVVQCFFLLIISGVFSKTALSQQYPVVGQPCPDFSLEQVEYFKTSSVKLQDFKGKWLILYFWSMGCPGGARGFQKMNQIQSEFQDQLQVLLIGKNDENNKNIRNLFEKFRKQYKLKMPSVYETKLFEQFVGDAGSPHIVIIKPNGVVYAITGSMEVTPKDVRDLLNGKSVQFQSKYSEYDNKPKPLFYIYKPMLVNGNGGNDTDFLYRSLLAKWNNDTGISYTLTLNEQAVKGQFQGAGLSIPNLYKFAYFGRMSWDIRDSLYNVNWSKIILGEGDSTLFENNYDKKQDRFNYSIIVPKEKATTSFIQQVMQQDLKNYFGYSASIEKRLVPCMKLIVKNPTLIQYAKPGIQDSLYVDQASFEMISGKIEQLLWTIYVFNETDVLVDSTGINRNIQINLNGDLSNFEHLRQELRKNGLDLVEHFIEMNTLVLRDPKILSLK